MKRVTLDELDEPMKSLIRNAATEETVVVDQGVVIAEIRVPIARTEGRSNSAEALGHDHSRRCGRRFDRHHFERS